jgi:Lon protease-like protein
MRISTLSCSAWLAALLCLPGALSAQTPAPASGLPATIPIFPLQDATLFPNASYPFYIFEPRYRAMIADALKGDRIIGMVTLQPGFEADYEGRPPIFPVGCAGVITAYEELPGGEYNIVLRGLARFRVTGEDNSRPYRLARVVTLSEELDPKETLALSKERQRIDTLLMVLSERFGVDPPPVGTTDEQVVDQLAQHLPMERVDRQRLLERDDALARAPVVIEVLEKIAKAP